MDQMVDFGWDEITAEEPTVRIPEEIMKMLAGSDDEDEEVGK